MVKRVPTIARFSGGLLCPIDLKLKTLRSYAVCVCVSLSLSARESVGRVCVRACMNTHTHIRNSQGTQSVVRVCVSLVPSQQSQK